MLINCSNHPSHLWSAGQKEAAEAYGNILDMPFPQVDPNLDPEGIRQLVRAYAEKIEALKTDAVFLAGEFTFVFMLADKLLKDGVRVLSACSRRETTETVRPDGTIEKNSVFVFERFREYAHYSAQEDEFSSPRRGSGASPARADHTV